MAQSLNSSHVYQQAGTFYNFAIPKSSQHRIEGSRSPRLWLTNPRVERRTVDFKKLTRKIVG